MKFLALAFCLICFPTWAQSTNDAVTQQNIRSTICVSGWTKTVRPPTAFTNKLKRQEMTAAKIPLDQASKYELDHQIPLALGGAPRDPKNLHLQLWIGPDGAHAKDAEERRMQLEVCAGKITLTHARACMAVDWHLCAGLTQ